MHREGVNGINGRSKEVSLDQHTTLNHHSQPMKPSNHVPCCPKGNQSEAIALLYSQYHHPTVPFSVLSPPNQSNEGSRRCWARCTRYRPFLVYTFVDNNSTLEIHINTHAIHTSPSNRLSPIPSQFTIQQPHKLSQLHIYSSSFPYSQRMMADDDASTDPPTQPGGGDNKNAGKLRSLHRLSERLLIPRTHPLPKHAGTKTHLPSQSSKVKGKHTSKHWHRENYVGGESCL
ncbi:hypothetical protein BU24DRAFT_71923 [Aaosphaeria arxii CBS 175.79]|uniref:Uncharacterized protein n=1 Tax=Aaosphaeria arxii CBS 175.79 TaxID=1450172 RepID=A0A6A5XBH2_9PLEO|nr:uncharacterized protein BU24DRAFT_71923 [Aaosphaeria arxii CBS 175.79]KAF2010147.1 hypothetical protein BU24DRAFT_71923 [Aaosphaeria arxii CBS 175.79]